MPTSIIEVQHLSKKYTIGENLHGRGARTFRDLFDHRLKSFFGRTGREQNSDTTLWALKDVSFEVQQGEVVGIIGRNGAGKSTLLKILSRITEPTEGKVTLLGRVASLLEVGTGFNMELTGSENIYLNGAILGMKKAEIDRKFDEIVDFAEIEKFIDTPVKRYSSGMYVRLAFAVAAHLEPDILVVDEVLAVGDAEFQKKCIGKMESVGKEGRTVLFVSHNMSMVEHLCERGILIEAGQISFDGGAKQCIDSYLDNSYEMARRHLLSERKDRSGSGRVRASSLRILDESGIGQSSMKSGVSYLFEIRYENFTTELIKSGVVSLDIFDNKGIRVLMFRNNFTNHEISFRPGNGTLICKVNGLPLALGKYRFSVFLSHADGEVLDHIEDAYSVTVDGGDFFGTGSSGLPSHCKILSSAEWFDGSQVSVNTQIGNSSY